VVPGLCIAVGHEGAVQYKGSFGSRQLEPSTLPAADDTVYDLASLTKALVTSVLVMQGVQNGRFQLDQPLGDPSGTSIRHPEVTLQRVLAHAGGFANHRRFYQTVSLLAGPSRETRAAIVEKAAAEPLAYEPGQRVVYSDLGFILLGALIEKAMGDRLDRLACEHIFRPLGISSLGFIDLLPDHGSSPFAGRNVAPTEQCPLRGRLVLGEVHDLNAYAMGGIAGHAGLFGDLDGVLALAFALCAAYRGDGWNGRKPIVDKEVLRLFWRHAGMPGSTWRLGWDGPAAEGSMAGSLLSRNAVGHLSFTGCSLWIDPEQALCVVVLTNRVHPRVRDEPRFRTLRPALHDAALAAIGYRAR
jgi:CubicO group peptidase (beta-lactamase class C family)